MEEKEYLGIFDIPYIERIIVKIKAFDREMANNKFMNYLNSKGHIVIDEFMSVIPLFAEFEII